MTALIRKNAALCTLLISAIAACSGAPDSSDGKAATGPAGQPPSEPKTVFADSGSIDIVVSGVTVEQNSRGDADSAQCQLSFTVANRGASEIKSLLVDFDLLNLTTAEVIKQGRQMVITTKIGVGETASPWGSEIIDDYRCTDLSLRFPAQPSYQCRTVSSASCAAFTYTGSDGVTVERAAPTDVSR